MNWIVEKAALKREGAQEILNCFPIDFPGIEEAQQSLARGESPVRILRKTWDAFRDVRQKELNQLITLQHEIQGLNNALDRYRKDTVYAELSQAQAELKERTEQAEAVQQTLEKLKAKLGNLEADSLKEISRLKKLIADQNSIIAKQRRQLQELTGENISPE